jgi:hypothetical protein
MSIHTFLSQDPDSKEQQIVVGNGRTKDELQETERWIAIHAKDAMEIKP